MLVENVIFVYILLGIIAVLLIVCVLLLFLVFKLNNRLKSYKAEAHQTDSRSEAALLCRSCARMYPASEKRCPYCGAKN